MSDYSITQFPRDPSDWIYEAVLLSYRLLMTNDITREVHAKIDRLSHEFYMDYISIINSDDIDSIYALLDEYDIGIYMIGIMRDAYLLFRSNISTSVKYAIYMRETKIAEKIEQTRGDYKKSMVRSKSPYNVAHYIVPYLENTIELVTTYACCYSYTHDIINSRLPEIYETIQFLQICSQMPFDTFMTGEIYAEAKKNEQCRDILLGDNYYKPFV